MNQWQQQTAALAQKSKLKKKKPTHKSNEEAASVEAFRLKQLTRFEEKARNSGYSLIAGVDEAGRGPLAGPVVAAACCIPDGVFFEYIDDSKKLSPALREQLYETITSNTKVSYSVAVVDHTKIDEVNIYQATIIAMIQAVDTLECRPDYLLVDGLTLPHTSIPSEGIIKGDAKSQSIAAASVLAKVERDRLMLQYHEVWPQYGFDRHKGYATAAHIEAIYEHGPCPIHRKSFEPIKSLLSPNNESEELTLFNF
jgi:ribonuclease HII